jgi:hypothetical protein
VHRSAAEGEAGGAVVSFAEGTIVPVERTRAEIERLLRAHGASQIGTDQDDRAGTFAITFTIKERRVRVARRVPTFRDVPPRRRIATNAWIEAETRRRWRAVLLLVKAKLEAVAGGDVLLEEEFLAHIVGPSGLTIYEVVKQLESNGKLMLGPVPVAEASS